MLSKKSQYAFQALTHLSEKFGEGPVLISDIALGFLDPRIRLQGRSTK